MSNIWLVAGKNSRFQQSDVAPAGLAIGLWHGAIIFFAWFASLYNSDYGIYEPNNNGIFYNTGFMFGAFGGLNICATLLALFFGSY